MSSAASAVSDGASSVGSDASGKSGASSSASAALEGEDEDVREVIKGRNASEELLFGILYEVQKSKLSDKLLFAVLYVLVDFAQLGYAVLHQRYGWDLDYSFPILEWWRRVQLQNVIADKGYAFSIALVWLTAILVLAAVATGVWMSWVLKSSSGTSEIRLPHVVIAFRFIRWVSTLLCGAFFMSTLGILTLAFDCYVETKSEWWGSGPAPTPEQPDLMWRLKAFPDRGCGEGLHVLHAAVAVAAAVVLFGGSWLFRMTSMTHDMITRDILATAESRALVEGLSARAVFVLAPVALSWHPTLEACAFVLAAFVLCWRTYAEAPYYDDMTTCVHMGWYSALLWASILLLAKAVGKDEVSMDSLTYALVAGAAVAALVGYLAGKMRLRPARRLGSRFAMDVGLAYAKEQFARSEDVSIAARCCRLGPDGYAQREVGAEPLDFLVEAAEALVTCGMQQFPSDSSLVIHAACFHLFVRGATGQSGTNALHQRIIWTREHLRGRGRLTREQRYAMYALSKTVKEMDIVAEPGEAGEAAVNFVEFQAAYRLTLSAHRRCLKYNRAFWKLLAKKDLQAKKILQSIAKMEVSDLRAQQLYLTLLQQYPQNVKVMRSYGRFLEEVRNLPDAADKYFAQAEVVETEMSERHRMAMEVGDMAAMDDDDEDDKRLASIGLHMHDYDYPEAMLVMDRFGVIKVANGKTNRMFGYKKGELLGKNVSQMMPAPFSSNHDSYLRRYAMTGKSSIMGLSTDLIALHRNRHIFPLSLYVSMVDYDDTDHYVGLFRVRKEDPTVGILYTSVQGRILCANEVFTDMFGFEGLDLLGKDVWQFVAQEADVVEDALRREGAYLLDAEVDDDEYEATKHQVTMRHQAGLPLACTMSVKPGGTSAQRILVVELVSPGGLCGVMGFTASGSVTEANRAAQKLLGGYSRREVKDLRLADILPEDFALFHPKWMQMGTSTEPTQWTCRQGRPIRIMQKDGGEASVSLQVSSRVDASTGTKGFIVLVQGVEDNEVEDARTLTIECTGEGEILTASGGEGVLGKGGAEGQWLADELPGMPLSALMHVEDARVKVRAPEPFLEASGATSQWLADALSSMMDRTMRGDVTSFRATLLPPPDWATTPPHPIAVTIEPLSGKPGWLVRAVKCAALEGFVEFDTGMSVVYVGGDAELMFGLPAERLEGRHVSEVMPALCPRGRTAELIGQKVAGGGTKSKSVVGPPRNVACSFGDGTTVNVHGQTAVKKSRKKGKLGEKSKSTSLYLMRITGSDGVADEVADGAHWGVAVSAEQAQEGGLGDGEEHASPERRINATSGDDDDAGSDGSHAHADDDEEEGGMGTRGEGDVGPVALDPELAENAGLEMREEMEDLSDDGKKVPGAGGPEIQEDTSGNKGDITTLFKPKLDMASPRKKKGPEAPANIDEWIGQAAKEAASSPGPIEVGGDGLMGEGGDGEGGGKGGGKQADAGSDEESEAADVDLSHGMSAAFEERDGPDRKRLRRYKQISHVIRVTTEKMSAKVGQVRPTVAVVLAVLCAAHIVGFTVIHYRMETHHMRLDNFDRMGQAGTETARICSMARVIEAKNNAHHPDDQRPSDVDMSYVVEEMPKAVARLHRYTSAAMLGPWGKVTKVTDVEKFREPRIDATMWDDSSQERYTKKLGLWSLANQFIYASRRVQQAEFNATTADMDESFRYMMDNGPFTLFEAYENLADIELRLTSHHLEELTNFLLAVLVGECILVVPICLLLLWRIVRYYSTERTRLLSAFLAVPRPTLVAMAAQGIEIDAEVADAEEDDDEYGGDAEDAGKIGGGAGGGVAAVSGGGAKMKFDSKKKLKPYSIDAYQLFAPVVVWCIILLGVYTQVYLVTKASDVSLVYLEVASMVSSEAAHLRYLANELVMAGQATEEEISLDSLDLMRNRLRDSSIALKQNYDRLLFGDGVAEMYGWVADEGIQAEVAGSIHAQHSYSVLLYRTKQCLRSEPGHGACYAADNAFHTITHHGLGEIVMNVVDAASLLAGDTKEDLVINNTNYRLIWDVGDADLLDGIRRAVALYHDTALAGPAVNEALVPFLWGVFVVGSVLAWSLVVLPFSRSRARVQYRVGQLLSELPGDVGALKLTEAALRGEFTGGVKNPEAEGAEAGGAGGETGGKEGGKGGGGANMFKRHIPTR